MTRRRPVRRRLGDRAGRPARAASRPELPVVDADLLAVLVDETDLGDADPLLDDATRIALRRAAVEPRNRR